MITHTNKVIASIFLGAFAIYYFLLGLAVFLGLQSPLGLLFILATLIAIGAIVGIFKEKRLLLALGLFLALVQLLDGVSSIANKYIFGDDILVGLHIIIAIAYIYPIMIISKTLRKISRDKTK